MIPLALTAIQWIKFSKKEISTHQLNHNILKKVTINNEEEHHHIMISSQRGINIINKSTKNTKALVVV